MRLLFLLFPVFVTLFWAIVLLFNGSKENYHRVFLGKFMLVVFMVNLLHLLIFLPVVEFMPFGKFNSIIDPIYVLSSLVVFPMYYLYIRLLLVDRVFSLAKHGYFFIIPLFFFLLSFAGHFLLPVQLPTSFLDGVLVGEAVLHSSESWMGKFYLAFRVFFVMQVVFYLFFSLKAVKSHPRERESYYYNNENQQVESVRFLVFSVFLISVVCGGVAIMGSEVFFSNDLLLASGSLVFGSALFAMGLFENKRSIVVLPFEFSFCQETSDYVTSYGEIKNKMENIFENERIFLNSNLKISDLADMLGTNRTYVSKIINQFYGRNFCTHVNYYRVQYAKELMESQKMTKIQVTELAGFGSVNSMYRSFQLLDKKK